MTAASFGLRLWRGTRPLGNLSARLLQWPPPRTVDAREDHGQDAEAGFPLLFAGSQFVPPRNSKSPTSHIAGIPETMR